MKTKKEKLKQNNLSSKKNRVANQNNKRNKKFRDWSRKEHDAEKTFLRSKIFISVAKNFFAQQKNFFA